jgi:predicted N-acetyltransferase YhbS
MAERREDVEFRVEVPDPAEFLRLFRTTGWDPDGRLTLAGAREALDRTWYAVSAYAGDRLVGTGRIVGDGVLHALLSDVIVDPAWQRRGIGREIVARLTAEAERCGVFDVQLFCAKGHRRFYEQLGYVARPEDAPGMELAR